MLIDYPHRKAIHCETGSIRNLLQFNGLEIREELIFGIGSGYDFISFPFEFVPNVCECTLYRVLPTKIFSQFCKRMNIEYKIQSFFNKENSMKTLDSLLAKGIPTAIVTELAELPYFFSMRGLRFSGHHVVVVGKDDKEYFISDTDDDLPEGLSKLSIEQLKKARFTNELMSPRGKLFYIKSVSNEFDIKKAIIKGIKQTCYKMLDIPMPFFGVKGIFYHSKRMRNYEKKYGEKYTWSSLKLQVKMAEEGGSGGSGFRYVYSNFLELAAEYFDNDSQLLALSDDMRHIADRRQVLALETIRMCEGRKEKNINALSDIAFSIAQMEEKVFTDLREWVKKQ